MFAEPASIKDYTHGSTSPRVILPESWIDCACGARYSTSLASCPNCSAPNAFYGERKKSRAGFIVAAVVGAVAAALVAVMLMNGSGGTPVDSMIRTFQPEATGPVQVPQEELVQHALAVINSEREKAGLEPVSLSANEAAQVHAEDVHRTKQISHWMENGEKPYMTYTRLGGEGSVHQNVAIAGFGPEEYDNCVSTVILCERIDPVDAIDELSYEMVYNDEECCDNGHRENILDPNHTNVSIGISYDQYYIALVQNFEADYSLDVSADGSDVEIEGRAPAGAQLHNIAVYYDPLPTPQAYEDNKDRLAYDAGEFVASVFEPLPFGMQYQQPEDYEVIEADSWMEGRTVDARFDLGPVMSRDGVYTVYATFEDRDGEQFTATSYSIFVDNTAGEG
jgi:hypothetical protein